MQESGPYYRDRAEAGQALAELLLGRAGRDNLVLAVPNGGVAVAAPIAQALAAPLRLLVVRKIQFPHNTEAGFGAVAADGSAVVDRALTQHLGLSPAVVQAQTQAALASVQARLAVYGPWARLPRLAGRELILVDDGLASGSTMEAAIAIVRAQGPARVTVAAPTASARAAARLSPLADELVVPHVGRGPVFAVASAYARWYDVGDAEVLAMLERLNPDGAAS
ncbi:MAG: phosphoribosyltransferase [Desulfarculus sp.]|nr:MAG: phosphoribosyltransferase [Desulfarculus sp.]